MRYTIRQVLTLLAATALGGTVLAQPAQPPVRLQLQPAQLQARLVAPGIQKPGDQALTAEIIVLGKVIEIEKDTVDAIPYVGAPKENKVPHKIAVVKIDESLMGGKGLTQFRVGFPADAVPAVGLPAGGPPAPIGRLGGGRPVRLPPPIIALTAGMEGCFFLTHHHDGDFYIVSGGMGAPMLKSNETYAKDLDEVKKVVKAIDDPVTALKAKELNDRFAAARVILTRYQMPRAGASTREPIPAEENKLILALLAELPWLPDTTKPVTPTDPTPPSRSGLWYSINANELGFKAPRAQPQRPGEPAQDYNKELDEATLKFLKDNADTIKIKRYVVK